MAVISGRSPSASFCCVAYPRSNLGGWALTSDNTRAGLAESRPRGLLRRSGIFKAASASAWTCETLTAGLWAGYRHLTSIIHTIAEVQRIRFNLLRVLRHKSTKTLGKLALQMAVLSGPFNSILGAVFRFFVCLGAWLCFFLSLLDHNLAGGSLFTRLR